MKRNRTKSVIAMILTAVLCLTTVCPAMGAEAVDEALTAIDAAAEEVEGKDAEEKSVEETDVPEEAAPMYDESTEGQEAVEDAGDASSLDEDVIREEGETTEDQKEMPDSAASGETVSSEGYEEDVIVEDADGETAVSEEVSGRIDSGTCGINLRWSMYSDGLLTISGTGKMFGYGASYESPQDWYIYRGKIKRVIIEKGVTGIGAYAFYSCEVLTSVTIPDSVTSIGEYAFANCRSLTEVTIPDGVTIIEYNLFYYCTSLTSITIPETVTTIYPYAFSSCSSLQTLNIPASVTVISTVAFGYSGLSTIYFYGPKPTMDNNVLDGVECTAYYPNTWETVPSPTEYGGNVTWISWDSSTGTLPGEETTVKAGYEIEDVSNVDGGIMITLPTVLESPETCPDGVYLLRKEDNGEFAILNEYQFGDDWVSSYSFAAKPCLDVNTKIGKTYTYALQLYKGTVKGEIGPEKKIIRNWLPEIEAVIGYDWNRFPIYMPGNNRVDVQIRFLAELFPEAYTKTSLLGTARYFNGSVKLLHDGKDVLTSATGSIPISKDLKSMLIWTIEADKLKNASLLENASYQLCFYDQNGEKIREYPIKTSFERLSFCNTKDKKFEAQSPGTRVLDDQLIADEITLDFFGHSRGQYLKDHLKKGEQLGATGLCFGMAATTDQFQAHLLSAVNHLHNKKLDLVDQNSSFDYEGQPGTRTLLDLVKRQHLYQYTAEFVRKKTENMFDFRGLLKAIDDYNNGTCNLMPMIWLKNNKSTHAVLAYRYERIIQDDIVNIYVYEPGDPYRIINGPDMSAPSAIQIKDYSSAPEWLYTPFQSPYVGSPSDFESGYEFSWVLPDWDIFSDDPNEDYALADISSDLVFETFNFIKRLPGNIKSFLFDDDEHSILLWLSGDGEVDLTGVCSGLTLVGSDYEYTVEGVQSLVFNLEKEEGGTASRVKSVTVGGNEDTVITYRFDGEMDTKTFVKRLGGDDTLITVESSDPDKSTDWSEVSSEPIEDGEQLNGIAWSFDGETLTVSGKGDIPDYDSFRDTPWYGFRNRIRKVVIGEGIVRIGNGAFCGTHGVLYPESDPRGHDSILEVEFPSTLRSIGDSAFENCNQLKVVKLPQAFSGSIGKAAFHNCFSITTLDLGTSLTEIGEAAFKACTRIESVTIPASVKTIADGYGMDSETGTYLAKVIPDTGAFDGCKGLRKVIYKSNADVAARMFAGCTSLTEVDISGSPGEIGTYAFYNGKSLSSVKIPTSVNTISEGAFDKCDALADVHYGGSREEWGKVSILTDNEALQKASIHYAKEAVVLGKTTRGDMFNLANNVKVTWKEVPGAKYYKVYREGVTDKKESQKDPVIVTTGLIGWDKQPGLTNGHAYRYKIVASLTGKGDPSGDSKLSYSKLMYRLKTVVIRSAKNTAPGKVTVKYDKTTSGDSYVLQYCEREDMVGAKTKVVLGASNTSYVVGGLKKGKTYYISIRVRKKVNGIDYYTTFGVPKKVTISK